MTDDEGRIASYEIELLPALPSIMDTGSVRGMVLRGGFILDMSWSSGDITHYHIENPLNNAYTIL